MIGSGLKKLTSPSTADFVASAEQALRPFHHRGPTLPRVQYQCRADCREPIVKLIVSKSAYRHGLRLWSVNSGRDISRWGGRRRRVSSVVQICYKDETHYKRRADQSPSEQLNS